MSQRGDGAPDMGLSERRRWMLYGVMIALALGQAAGKILSVNAVDSARLERYRIDAAVSRARDRLVLKGLQGEQLQAALVGEEDRIRTQLRMQRPFLSANDRSRWLAIRAIAENGVHHIDPLLEEPTWDTIDMVQHRGRDGELHLYSSKPPLLMVLLAGPYWLLMHATGTSLGEAPFTMGRTMLLVFNGAALALLLTSVARLLERFGSGDVDRLFAMGAACFATQLSAFAPVLSNHLFAAAMTAVAVDAWTRFSGENPTSSFDAFLVGLTSALAAAFELPALSLTVLAGASLLARSPSRFATGFLPPALIVAAAFFACNYWAHNTLAPPYANRSAENAEDNWYDYEYTVNGRVRESYWRNRQGIDVGEPSVPRYALHALVGHHGVFSLTPVWMLSFVGLFGMVASREKARWQFAAATLLITAACLVFYIGLRPQEDRNYGGSTTGFRWLFWLAPMWLAAMPSAVRRCEASRLKMAIALALLAISAVSVSYATWNPWTHPWAYRWLEHLGFEVP